MSLMHVARENITYRCSHHASSSIPIFPCGSRRAQSMVTPARNVCPWAAVDVKKAPWVKQKPVRVTSWQALLLHRNCTSLGSRQRKPRARRSRARSLQLATCDPR